MVEWLSVVAAGPGPPQPDPGASGEPVRRLHYLAGSVLVVAGIPGAGKTTLIERLFTGGAVTVLDSDTVRRRYARALGARVPYRLYRPLVHLAHYVRIARALSRPGSVVVHECGTRRLVRRWIARRAAREGRPCHLLFLDVTPEVAQAGQRARGRLVRARSFRRHGRAWGRLRARLLAPSGAAPTGRDGYASWVVLSRPAADALRGVGFDVDQLRSTRTESPGRTPARLKVPAAASTASVYGEPAG